MLLALPGDWCQSQNTTLPQKGKRWLILESNVSDHSLGTQIRVTQNFT